MDNTNSLPDNLKSRLSRVYVANKSFTNSDGEKINYQRLVLVGQIKNKEFQIETKLEQKDITLLEFADVVEQAQLGEE